MSKPSIAELLRASGHTVFTADLVVRAVDTLYGYIGAGLDERDWDAILASEDPLAASETALVTMYSDQDFLLRNADHLSANYGAAQIDYTYRQIAERLGTTHANDWAAGTRYESAAELDDSAVKSQARRDYEQRQDNDNGGGGGDDVITITATDRQDLDINGGNGDDTVVYTAFAGLFTTGANPSQIRAELSGGGGTDTIRVDDAINSANDLRFDRVPGFERLVQNDTGAADITIQTAQDLEEIDISASTNNSTVDISAVTPGITITAGNGDEVQVWYAAENDGGTEGNADTALQIATLSDITVIGTTDLAGEFDVANFGGF